MPPQPMSLSEQTGRKRPSPVVVHKSEPSTPPGPLQLAKAIAEAGQRSAPMPATTVTQVTRSLEPIPWIDEAIRQAASVSSDANEPSFTLTRHQLAALIDGGARVLLYERNLQEWYVNQQAIGNYDVRLDKYSFRRETYDEEMRNRQRRAPTESATASVQELNDNRVVQSAAKSETTMIPSIFRLKFPVGTQAVVFDSALDVHEVTTSPRDMGANVAIKRIGSNVIDVSGRPLLPTSFQLDVSEYQVMFDVTADYMVVANSYLITGAGVETLNRGTPQGGKQIDSR